MGDRTLRIRFAAAAPSTRETTQSPFQIGVPFVSMDAKQVWRAALGELQVSLSPANFETWLRETSLADVDDNRFRVAVPGTPSTRSGPESARRATTFRPHWKSRTLTRPATYGSNVHVGCHSTTLKSPQSVGCDSLAAAAGAASGPARRAVEPPQSDGGRGPTRTAGTSASVLTLRPAPYNDLSTRQAGWASARRPARFVTAPPPGAGPFRLTGTLPKEPQARDEADVSAEETASGQGARLPRPDEDAGWTPRPRGTAREGSTPADRLKPPAVAGRLEMLRTRRQFAALQEKSKTKVDPLFVARFTPNDLATSRFGF